MPYTTEWEADDDAKCRHCGERKVVKWRRWESSDEAHEDICYSCDACQHVWWVDGCDY